MENNDEKRIAQNGFRYTLNEFKDYYAEKWLTYWEQAEISSGNSSLQATVHDCVANSQDIIPAPPGLTGAPQPSPTTDFQDSSISAIPLRDIWDVPFFNLLLPKRTSELEASVF